MCGQIRLFFSPSVSLDTEPLQSQDLEGEEEKRSTEEERDAEREKENVTDIERWRERRREGEERENEIWEDEGRLTRRREVKR